MKKPRILFWDTETRPVRAWIFDTGKQYVSHEQIIDGDHFDIICVAWKWLGESEVHSLNWGSQEQDSSKMIEQFTKIIESADLPIAHNGDGFDLKQLNAQRLLHNQAPITWPTTEDTLKQFRKYFAFPSYSLDYLAKTLLGEGKSPMSRRDWIDIVQYKDKAVLDKMIKYCKRDVRLLEGIYKKASKYFKPKIHVGIMNGMSKLSCPSCGSSASKSWGRQLRAGSIYQIRQCTKCSRSFAGSKIA